MRSILTFVTEDDPAPGQHCVQWQFRDFTINCVARDLAFAQEIIDFVAATRANPAYRDTSLEDGSYLHMPEKSIDLSSRFSDVMFKVQKLGEWDHGYEIRISSGCQFWISFEVHEEELDDFLDGLREIADIH